MQTSVHEIADGICRLSSLLPDITPDGFTMNQFLVDAEEPLLFHCGPRALFSLVSEAAARVLPLDRLRWITFGHVEADECGSMTQWLAAAPRAEVAHGVLGCEVSINDLADRPPRPLVDGGTGCGRSPPRTCRTRGKRRCSSTRRPGHCSAAICSPRSAVGPHCARRRSRDACAGRRGHVRRDRPDRVDRAHDPGARWR